MSSNLERSKCEQACSILKELDIDSWLVWVRETSQQTDPVLELIFGGDVVWQSAFILTNTGEKIAIVGNFDADGIKSLNIYDKVIPYTKGIKDELLRNLSEINPQKIAINYSKNDVAADGLSVGMHMILQEYLTDTPYLNRLVSAENLVQKIRGRKSAEEIDRIKRAVAITEEIFREAERFVKLGMTEIEIYNKFHESMVKHGVTSAWNDDHNPAVDAGPNKQFGHAGPIENKTKSGHLLHFDFGVRYKGYCSDIQRMFFFGKESDIPEEVQHAFDTVRDAILAASKYIRPGVLGYEVDSVARDFVKNAGYEEYQHALGHQVGRHAHDGGVLLGPKWERYGDTILGSVEAGNIFTLELYVTTENFGQVSLEEDILITNKGCEFLSSPQKKLICIK
ncbi:aminopeptidase P family protein [Candidatus Thorarchaeota archaeon]|nr:MAG: aminopeptidase P family protein [Candidatus Thorarchaeota archaeon]